MGRWTQTLYNFDPLTSQAPALFSINVAGEPRWLRGPIGRPLEPDAGNAAEGSEGPFRIGDFSDAIFCAWLVV